MDIEIRHINDNDYEGWIKLWRQYLTFYKSELPDAVSIQTFTRLQPDEFAAMEGFVAETRNGELVGFVHMVRHADTWDSNDIVYLQDLFVDPAMRGTGLGRRLIETIYARADQLNCCGVYWKTEENNKTARLLYNRLAHKSSFVEYTRDPIFEELEK